MSEPTTTAGRALLAGLADALGTTSDSALGTHGEQFRERIEEAVARELAKAEAEACAEATAAERARITALFTVDTLALKLTRIRGAHNNADYETEEGEPCGWCRLAAEQARAAVLAAIEGKAQP